MGTTVKIELYEEEKLNVFANPVQALIDDSRYFRANAFAIAHQHQKMLFVLRALVSAGGVPEERVLSLSMSAAGCGLTKYSPGQKTAPAVMDIGTTPIKVSGRSCVLYSTGATR